MVLMNRQFVEFDYHQLRHKVAATVSRLSEVNAETKQQMEAIAPHVSAHCIGLACKHYHVQRTLPQTPLKDH